MSGTKNRITSLAMPEWPRQQAAPQPHRRFMLGKYEIVAQPIPGSTHMLRYTVFLSGRRIGAMASVPTESDCRHLEKPPAVPPLKPFHIYYRPGRPKKGAAPPVLSERAHGISREELPVGLPIPAPEKTEDG